ncbi:9914_t:CDS:1 [Ambispora gerdemannii]|uniref:9914_t:CDS:1 n=1 Tax=Ambispora gerdemannii TaxID=144530 RepID=A0A9N9G3B9_9GLOM|nr:9914_t:CDS:1 [Ambispora gerdemannii]
MTLPYVIIPEHDIESRLESMHGPATEYKCGNGLKPSQVSHFTPGQSVDFEWAMGAAREGICYLDISTTGRFYTIGTIKDCANESDGSFKSTIQLPSGVECERCTLRFRWMPASSGDTFMNCADISISSDKETKTPSQPKRKRNNNKSRNLNKRKPSLLDDSFFKRDLVSSESKSDIVSQTNKLIARQWPCIGCV